MRHNALCDEQGPAGISQSRIARIIRDIASVEPGFFSAPTGSARNLQAGHLHGNDKDKETAAAAAAAAAEEYCENNSDVYDALIEQIRQQKAKHLSSAVPNVDSSAAEAELASPAHKKQRYTFDIDRWAEAEVAKAAGDQSSGQSAGGVAEEVCAGEQFEVQGCSTSANIPGLAAGQLRELSCPSEAALHVVVGHDRLQVVRTAAEPAERVVLRSVVFAGNRLSWESTADGLSLWYLDGCNDNVASEEQLLVQCSLTTAKSIEDAIKTVMMKAAQPPPAPSAPSDLATAAALQPSRPVEVFHASPARPLPPNVATMSLGGDALQLDAQAPAGAGTRAVAAVEPRDARESSGLTISGEQLKEACIQEYSSSLCGRPGCDARGRHYHCVRDVILAGSKCVYKTEDRTNAFAHGNGHRKREEMMKLARGRANGPQQGAGGRASGESPVDPLHFATVDCLGVCVPLC